MKICFFINSLSNAAGTERITVDVANALARNGYQIQFVLLGDNLNSFYELESAVKIYTIHSSFSQKIKSVFRLKKWISYYKPDYIVNVAFQMAAISLLACVGCRTKVITWDHFFLESGSKLGYLMRLISATFGYKQVVLTETDRLHYPVLLRSKIICIPNFTKLNIEEKMSDQKAKTVISVGRLNHCKGFDLLIRSWAKVAHFCPDWKLQIVGGGDDLEALNSLVNKNNLSGTISILPPTKDILSIYLNSSLYVLSSRFEPFGLVLIEAKACGLPIISFDCPNGPKHIVRNGLDGILVDPENTDKLSETILSVIEDSELRKKFSKHAQQDYRERWSENVIVCKWKSLLV